jgi:hypothetical protein
MFWTKFYIAIIVLIIFILLHYLQLGISEFNKKYNIQEKYHIPINCMSASICGISGQLLFFLIIFLIIPSDIFLKIKKKIFNSEEIANLDKNIIDVSDDVVHNIIPIDNNEETPVTDNKQLKNYNR